MTTASQSEDYSYSLDIVRDTKCRLMNLEKEAQVSISYSYQWLQFELAEEHSESVAVTDTACR